MPTHQTCTFLILALLAVLLTGCAPETGSEAWCTQMNDKPKGDWSMNETTAFAKNCVFK